MITAKNYYDKIAKGEIVKSTLPDALKTGFDFVDKVTLKGSSWSAYETSVGIKKTINLYFVKLDEFLGSKKPTAAIIIKTEKNPKRIDRSKEPQKKSQRSKEDDGVEIVEQIIPEIKFIRRFLNMHGKKKDQNQIRLFISALQKAIRERRITKTSKYADEIMGIQDFLIKFHSKFSRANQKIQCEIPEGLELKSLFIIGKQVEYQSVKFIKSYISLQGKIIPTQKAKNLHNRIAIAQDRNKITSTDKYWNEIQSIRKQLKAFATKNPRSGILKIETRELNGLNGILSSCGCHEIQEETNLNGLSRVPENTIMNSMDAIKLSFEKLGLTGKWLDLIGNPSTNFTAMIFGRPKMGKSILAIDFAGYLARNHGRVLYVAKEEGIDDTLISKLENVAHSQLDTSNYLPENLNGYDFIFLDSVTKLGLTPDDLNDLKQEYPDKAFIYIFQSTKQGIFRGNNEFQHDVDVVIEIPELGKAIQFGRFNQGGSMNIFDNNQD